MKILWVTLAFTLFFIAPANALTTIFDDTFGGDSTINFNPASPVPPTLNSAAYQQASAKTFSPNPPSIASGHLQYGIISTASGFNSIEALFTNIPVLLVDPGDYIEMTLVFTNQTGILDSHVSNTIMFGLYNTNQVQPIPGGLNGTVVTATTGFAQNWQGYVSRITVAGSPSNSTGVFTRPAQLASATSNQDLLYSYQNATAVGSVASSTTAPLATGTQCTEVYRITMTGSAALTVTSSLYAGSGTNGAQLFSQTTPSTTGILTSSFDGLAIGYRETGSIPSAMDVNSIEIVSNVNRFPIAISTQPAPTQMALVGAPTYLSVQANGNSTLTYQWNKNGNPVIGGTSADLFLNNVQLTDAGTYCVSITNAAAGSSMTSGSSFLTVIAPATASAPTLPTIPQTIFNVVNYGAVGDGQTDNTLALQNALNAANGTGGGTVRIPAATGSYLSGPLTLKSKTNLQIDYGAVLQMLPFDSESPRAPTAGHYPINGTSYSNFISCSNAQDVEISGMGTIDGQGGDWWPAYTADDTLPHRPRLVNMTGMTRVLVTNVTFTNSPSFHLCPGGNYLTIFGVTINTTTSGALNSDGIDISGMHQLIQNCNVADGDDNIVEKPGSVFCGDIMIANCMIGVGHGLSIGGQTTAGLNGMTVTSCTFNGTNIGLRMKADSTQGGIVQNVTFSNITMTNVPAPIAFFSYYTQIGGGIPGSKITPAIVNSWNGDSTTLTTSTTNINVAKTPNQPINPLNTTTIPVWRNITINNLTATGASNYSSLWGLPLADYLVSNVVLNNVSISGGLGFLIYDATNVQFTGTTDVGTIKTGNSLAITSQPQSVTVNQGSNATFNVTAVGASGLSTTAPGFRWYFNGTPLTNGTATDGSIVNGSTTNSLVVSNVRTAEQGNYTALLSNSLDGYDVNNNLLVGNSLSVSATSSAATLTVVSSYTIWATSFGLNALSDGAVNADPDRDGIPNLVEFVLGGNPTVTNSGILPSFTRATVNNVPSVVYQFTENAANAAAVTGVVVQYSADLGSWTPAVDGVNGVTIAIATLSSSTQRVTVTIPLNGQPHLFTRLRIVP